MKYVGSGRDIQVGDSVSVEDDAEGVVVCDFDHRKAVEGYEDWLPENGAVEGIPTQGVLIATKKYGLIHYESEDDSIKKNSDA